MEPKIYGFGPELPQLQNDENDGNADEKVN